ncbi:MAG TPA: hypothetical protein VGS19_38640 [Streptosporangiaceae bacterium]|nr:hypothetical protein [Streptosporangiaceae bacterium]
MSVTALMTELATDPVRLAEFRADPSRVLDAAGLEESSAADVFSRDPSRVLKAIAIETGAIENSAMNTVHIIITVEILDAVI